MSKQFSRIALFAGAAGLALSASQPVQAQEMLRLSTLGPGSSPYLVMSTFANIVNEHVEGVQIQVNATGAATRHMVEAGRGEIEFYMSSPTIYNFMSQGTVMYSAIEDAPELAQNLRSLLSFPLGAYHVIAYADSGIESLNDLEGRRVFLGPPGGGALATAIAMVEAATGLETDTDMEVVQVGWDAAAQAFQDGQLDVYVNPTNAPSPVIQQIAFARPIRIIGLSPEMMEREALQTLINRPGGTLDVIEPGTYGEGQVNEAPITTIGSNVSIGTRVELDADLVHSLVSAFWDNVRDYDDGSPWMGRVRIEDALVDLNYPLHPGALAYYEEIGVEVPDALHPPQ
ncbi:MAG: TAXI family TRAP transporter solute-binding subunit [Azospirillaceae bacterium]